MEKKTRNSKPRIDLTGKTFGNLTVIERDWEYQKKNNYEKPYWKCQCSCGNMHEVTTNLLRTGKTTSCGCRKGGRENLTGQRFGRLTVEKYSHTANQKAF